MTQMKPNKDSKANVRAEEDSVPQFDLVQAEALPAGAGLISALARPRVEVNLATGRNRGDRNFSMIVRAIVFIVLLIVAGIVAVLVIGAWPAMQRYGLGFIVNSGWDPVNLEFGAFPFIVDTLLVAAFAMLLAGTVGLGITIYITEFAPKWLREPISFLIEMLAFIPSVVYGLWALLVMTPWLQQNVQPWLIKNLGFIPFFKGAPYGVGLFAATLILSIMLLPIVVALSREALLLVPHAQKEAMYALGATKWEVIRRTTIPYARVGIFGAIVLALGRALGETMAVAMTIGGGFNLPKTINDQGYTLASVIANEFNEVSSDMYLSALIYCGLILFVLTVVVNVGAFSLINRLTKVR